MKRNFIFQILQFLLGVCLFHSTLAAQDTTGVRNILPSITQQNNPSEELRSDFMTEYQYAALKIFKKAGFHITGNCTGQIIPGNGISDIPLSAIDASSLLTFGLGWKSYVGNFVFNQDFSIINLQLVNPQESKDKVALNRFVNFSAGYSVVETSGFRLSPMFCMGFGHIKMEQGRYYNLYNYLGGEIDFMYSIPFGASAITPTINVQRGVIGMYSTIISLTVGYAQYFSSSPYTPGVPTHNSIYTRLTIGIGAASFLSDSANSN